MTYKEAAEALRGNFYNIKDRGDKTAEALFSEAYQMALALVDNMAKEEGEE